MVEKKRFLLRNEYFGGIMHDIVGLWADVFDHEQYDIVAGLENKEGRQKAKALKETDKGVESLINKLLEKKAINSDLEPQSMRFLKHGIPSLPDRTLASPLRVYDTYGYGCNLNCQGCLNKSCRERLDENRRTPEDTKKIMDKFYEAGTMEWRFTGGEPTFYPDFLEAVAYAKSIGMSIMLTTNGCWDEKKIEPILNSGLSEIIISIEGEEKVNDQLRGVGVYKRIMKTIGAINEFNSSNPKNKVNVTLNQTISKTSKDSVEHVVMLAAKNNFNVNFVPLRPYGRASFENLLTTAEFMEFSREVQSLRDRLKSEGYKIKVIHKNMDLFNKDMPDKSKLPYPFNYSTCSALATGFGLSPDGRVNACSFLTGDERFNGLSLLDEKVTVYDAWLHPKMDKIRKAERVGCTSCDYYMKQCEGKCIAMVYSEGQGIKEGKLLGKDRYCFSSMMKK